MKKLLIITYYWPPAGGAGVQRWLKFAKYLRDFGWEPVIYTPENSEIPEADNSLIKDIPANITVLRQPIWEPYNIYKLITFSRKKKINVGFLSESKKPKLSEKFSVWIRSNFFIPDARCFWIRPSVRYLKHYLENNPVDAIISTGPPHSMHMIGLKLMKKINFKLQTSNFKLPCWIADFRDPWTNIDFYKELKLSDFADRKHHRLEMQVLRNADAVITVGKTMADEFSKIFNRDYEVITNGFDSDDIPLQPVEADKKFTISHIGSMPRTRNPEVLWNVLKDMIAADSGFAADIEIKLIGKVDINIIEDIENKGLKEYTRRVDYLPHSDVIKAQCSSQVLLLMINNTQNAKGILTGKFFEYLAANRPVLCVGPEDGEVAQIIRETNSGVTVTYSDSVKMKNVISGFYNAYKLNKLTSASVNIEKYSRKQLTAKLSGILNKLSK